MMRLARQTVRARLRTFASPFVALFMATVLVIASGVLVESGIRAVAPPDRYAGADLVVAASQQLDPPLEDGETVRLPERARVPAALADRIAAVDGVRKAVVDRQTPVAVSTGDALLAADDLKVIGRAWSNAALWPAGRIDGHEPRAAHEVALDADLAAAGAVTPGSEVRITTPAGTKRYIVSAIVSRAQPVAARHAPVFFADATARAFAIDPDRADSIGVLLESGADVDAVVDEIRAAVGDGQRVLAGDDRALPESLEMQMRNQELIEFGGAFGSTALLLAAFVVAATLGLSILQRGHEIALLRAAGATPGQIRRLIVGESAIVATIAGVAGIAPGLWLGALLFDALAAAGIMAETATLRLGPLPALIGVAVAVIAACVSAAFAGRRAARIHPTAALSEAAIEPQRIGWIRTFLGVALIAGGGALTVLAASLEGETGASAVVGVLLTLLLGIALLGPVLARGAGWLGAPFVMRFAQASGFLAGISLRARARRMSTASIPLALAVALTLAMVGSLTVESAATDAQARDRLIADRVLVAPAGVPPGTAAALAGEPGIDAAVEVYPTTAGVIRAELFGERVFEMRPAVGLSPAGVTRVLDLDVQAGSLEDLDPGTVALSTELARTMAVNVGDEVPLWLGDGTERTFAVAAVYARSLGFGDAILARDAMLAHVSVPMASEVLIAGANGATDAMDESLVAHRTHLPGLEVLDRDAWEAQWIAAGEESAALNYLFVGVLAAFVAIAMVNSLILATAERARELALLRLVGATPGQVLHMMRLEALVLVVYGTTIGALVAAATLVPFSLGIAGSPVPAVPPLFVLAVVASAIALGLAATEIPARLLLRRDPIATVSAPG